MTRTEPVLKITHEGPIAILTMNRPTKRNAMSDELLDALGDFFRRPPPDTRAVVLTGTAGHFCSGLDLSEHFVRTAEETLHHSRGWHGVMDAIQFGGLPVVSAMFGTVIGGGLELATSTHVRIAEPSCVFQLPEGRLGIYVGGGATARVGRIIGADRMTEMMLTGRKYNAAEALTIGLTHYAVGTGEALPLAIELASKIARNAPLSNYMMINTIARAEDMSKADALYLESLSAAVAQTTPDAEEGMRAFLEKRPPKFR
ncbi:MAG: crotonase/enoyl-CoA hydratase family protein [Rhodobacteraceae bacterium]|nr:crotonase/enoyl-CoA hydratase family protein [Paracoccaceae bacterium]